MYRETGDPKLKSLSGPQGWNVWLINQMQKNYRNKGTSQTLQTKFRLNKKTADSFIKNLPLLEGKDLREGIVSKIIDSTGKVIDTVPDAFNVVPLVIGILAVGVAGYLIYSGKSGTKLTPF
jgi:hypothetical protein